LKPLLIVLISLNPTLNLLLSSVVVCSMNGGHTYMPRSANWGFQVTTYSYAISPYQTLTPFAIMHARSPVSSCMSLCAGEWDSEYVKIMSRLQRVWEHCLQHCDAIKLTSHSYASTLHMDSLKVLCYWIWADIKFSVEFMF